MKLIFRNVKELEDSQYDACYSLNLRNDGYMRERLVKCRYNGHGTAVMLFDNDMLLSWSLVFEYGDLHGAYFYTRQSQRGKGYGGKVAKEVYEIFGRVKVWPSNKTADSFFDKYNFTPDYKYWSYR